MRRRLIGTVARVAAILGLVLVSTMGTASAQAKADPTFNINELINYGSGKCMGIPAGDVRAGAKVVQFSCFHDPGNHPDQWWEFILGDDSYNQIMNVGDSPTGLPQCLALAGGNAIIGWQLELYNCNGNPDQQWKFTQHGSSWVIWNGKSPDLIIAVAGGSTADLAAVELYHWEAHPDQSWVAPGTI
jgi:alpha-L-fucosidase 2